MTIPNFKNEEDWKQFQYVFDGYWSRKLELLTTVKDGLFPGYGWQSLPPSSIEVINDITQSLFCMMQNTHSKKSIQNTRLRMMRSSFHVVHSRKIVQKH